MRFTPFRETGSFTFYLDKIVNMLGRNTSTFCICVMLTNFLFPYFVKCNNFVPFLTASCNSSATHVPINIRSSSLWLYFELWSRFLARSLHRLRYTDERAKGQLLFMADLAFLESLHYSNNHWSQITLIEYKFITWWEYTHFIVR